MRKLRHLRWVHFAKDKLFISGTPELKRPGKAPWLAHLVHLPAILYPGVCPGRMAPEGVLALWLWLSWAMVRNQNVGEEKRLDSFFLQAPAWGTTTECLHPFTEDDVSCQVPSPCTSPSWLPKWLYSQLPSGVGMVITLQRSLSYCTVPCW